MYVRPSRAGHDPRACSRLPSPGRASALSRAADVVFSRSQKKWPAKFYSCMSGFIEPGESFEDAVQRELWEEAGVKVWDVRYHSSQPWVSPVLYDDPLVPRPLAPYDAAPRCLVVTRVATRLIPPLPLPSRP